MVAHVAALEPDTAAKIAHTHHVGMQQAPRQTLHPRRQTSEHVVGQPRAEQNLAHPDEQRQRRQRPAGRRAPHRDGHRVAGRTRAEQLHADPGHTGQRQADPHPAAEDQEQRHDQQRGDREVVHRAMPIIRCAVLRRC
jgi:hypothetical protein